MRSKFMLLFVREYEINNVVTVEQMDSKARRLGRETPEPDVR